MAKVKQIMSLAWTKNIAPNVLHVALKPEQEFNYIPGQFISLHFEYNGNEVKRSYSIANAPQSSEYIEFAISYQPKGVASEELFNHMQQGTKIEVSGPAGRLVLLENHPKRYVLIATGTGVTPYRAMLDQIEDIISTTDTEFLLLFGARNQAECLYFDEFTAFAAQHDQFKFEVFYSRELPSELAAQADNLHSGYVQSGFANYELNPDSDMVYLCGNPNMIDEAYPLLTEQGFTAKTVRREKYISSK